MPFALGTIEGSNIIYMRTKDALGNTSPDYTGAIYLDISGPTAPSLLSPTSGTYLSTGNISLLWSTGIDLGIGMSGYTYRISTGSTFSPVFTSGSVLTTGRTITGLADNTYYWRVYSYDNLNTSGARSNSLAFTVDKTQPTITFT